MPDKPPSYADRRHAEDLARRAPVYDAEHDAARQPKTILWVIVALGAFATIIVSIIAGSVGS